MEYLTLNSEVKCPVVGIGTFMLSPAEAENSVREALKMGYSLDFKLTDEEMAEIAGLDKGERYYHRTDEQLVGFAAWKPDFEKA